MPPIHSKLRDRTRDKALLIALEYSIDPNLHLDGVIAEINMFKDHLIHFHGYPPDNVDVLTDSDPTFYEGDVRTRIVSQQ